MGSSENLLQDLQSFQNLQSLLRRFLFSATIEIWGIWDSPYSKTSECNLDVLINYYYILSRQLTMILIFTCDSRLDYHS